VGRENGRLRGKRWGVGWTDLLLRGRRGGAGTGERVSGTRSKPREWERGICGWVEEGGGGRAGGGKEARGMDGKRLGGWDVERRESWV